MSTPRSGFGLIELMVALALGMLVVLGMTQMFSSCREAYLSQQSSAMLQEDTHGRHAWLSFDRSYC
ncbi:PilW family protein [Pseudomonas fragi]|uniref:PilW family protein n=1 Tax=Pseudomonas fragi TaxID=296 RepID=UPI003C6E452B